MAHPFISLAWTRFRSWLIKCRFPRWLSDHHWPILNSCTWLPVAGEYWNLEGIILRFCTMHCVSQSSSVAVTAFVILPHPSRHLSRPRLPRPSSDKHAELLCHSVIQQARESEREVREITPVHSFCLTSLWCETAQYYGFGAPAFPDQWTLNTLSWGLCSGMVEMQIFPAPEVKSFLYLLNPKKEYIFSLFHSQYTCTCLQQWEGPLHRVSLCAGSTSMTMKTIFKLIILLHDALNPARPRACKDQTRFKLLIITCCNEECDELHCDELW